MSRVTTVSAMAETTILLARHGETDWNRENRFQGHADIPLNDLGREQARSLAEALLGDGITAVYSSTLARAHETAQIVADRLGLPVRTDPRLMEIDVGTWSGLNRDEIAARWPEAFESWRAGVAAWDGETYDELAVRTLEALREIASGHPGETVLAVGHGGAVRVTLAHAEGMDLPTHRRLYPAPTHNCAVYRLVARNGTVARVD